MNDDPKSRAPSPASLAKQVLARDRRHVWHPYTQHGGETRADRAHGRQGRLSVRRRRQRDPRSRLLLVDLHAWAFASEAQCRARRAGGQIRACDVRRLYPPTRRRSCRSGSQCAARRPLTRVLLRRRVDLGRGRAEDRLSILDQCRRGRAPVAGRLRRRLSRRHARRHVARPRLAIVQRVPRSDVQRRGAPLPRNLRRRRCGGRARSRRAVGLRGAARRPRRTPSPR